ncbi:hypothetical protein NO2_0160 [Candidatus Termititenax persephonae]|uniref:Uncharacterized protein n=1 Tax=Candidatus Termititenax persephonae TaxID=2218525 RepID=A0A388TEN7_9BACT|nr:hypothetical protein NO2_0160 [Candidatus Termititenax persephonae]
MFDYSGFSEKKLLKLCDDSSVVINPSDWQCHWTAGIYSIGKCLRDYAGFPDKLPLNICTEHGPGHRMYDHIDKHEINNTTYSFLVSTSKTMNLYKTKSAKKVYHCVYPVIAYRRKYNIEQTKTARGTIVFPAHSLPEVDTVFDLDDFCRQLKALPAEFQPICVCLHQHDVNKGQHKEFIKRGFPVYTAGNSKDKNYIDRFYSILQNFKYSMSNSFGSYVYFSVEMGIPFSIIGTGVDFTNVRDSYTHLQDWGGDFWKNYHVYCEIFHNKPRTLITPEQKEFVEAGVGLTSSMTPRKMNFILWRAYRSYLLFDYGLWRIFKDIGHNIKDKLYMFFAKKMNNK